LSGPASCAKGPEFVGKTLFFADNRDFPAASKRWRCVTGVWTSAMGSPVPADFYREAPMEFMIDFATVRKIIRQEAEQARAEIAQLGVMQAYQRSLQRHDQRLADADDAHTLACKAGCSWCCHFSVDVRPVEVFNIIDFMQHSFTAGEQQQLRSEIAANSQALQQLDEMQRMQHNIKCPFLMQGRCSIYAARPQTCRNYHATNSTGCQQSYEQPGNLDIAPEYAPLVYQSGAAHVDAFSKAMLDAGYDINAYELNGALSEAMAQLSATQQRFSARMPTFTGLAGTEVPMEFIEADTE
jgi:Fe-S-cluster containining protein